MKLVKTIEIFEVPLAEWLSQDSLKVLTINICSRRKLYQNNKGRQCIDKITRCKPNQQQHMVG